MSFLESFSRTIESKNGENPSFGLNKNIPERITVKTFEKEQEKWAELGEPSPKPS